MAKYLKSPSKIEAAGNKPKIIEEFIGRAFMDLAELRTRELGLTKLSLIVFEQNKVAKKLYDTLGYQEEAREQVVAHPLIHHT